MKIENKTKESKVERSGFELDNGSTGYENANTQMPPPQENKTKCCMGGCGNVNCEHCGSASNKDRGREVDNTVQVFSPGTIKEEGDCKVCKDYRGNPPPHVCPNSKLKEEEDWELKNYFKDK